jgi:hypothetical protein
MTQTFIYAISNSTNNTIKIGYSKNPKKRLAELQVATADPLVLLFSFVGDFQLEQQIHRQLEDYRVSGEWFMNCTQVLEVLGNYRIDQFSPATHNPSSTSQQLDTIVNKLLKDNNSFEDFCSALFKFKNDFGDLLHLVAGSASIYYHGTPVMTTDTLLADASTYMNFINKTSVA